MKLLAGGLEGTNRKEGGGGKGPISDPEAYSAQEAKRRALGGGEVPEEEELRRGRGLWCWRLRGHRARLGGWTGSDQRQQLTFPSMPVGLHVPVCSHWPISTCC